MQPPSHQVTHSEALRVWLRVAALSFGGPTGQIAVMHRILVDEKRWISERRFLHALNYCMLLPGPEAQQLATYTGWLLHGWIGGLMAGGLFILPGFASILILSVLYAGYHDVGWVTGLFFGLKPAVLAVVVEALLRIGRRALRNRFMWSVAALAFVAIFFLRIPFPVIIAAAAAGGLLISRRHPALFSHAPGHAASEIDGTITVIRDDLLYHAAPTIGRAVRVISLWLVIWFAPAAALVWYFGKDSVFVQEAAFFSKTAVVTFGGAYAVLSYIAQVCVENFGWLKPHEMLDGLGMAETTPGPLIQVVQFVGFMGAYRHSGDMSPMSAGVLGSVVTTWVTFTPCFLWIFLGAPYIEKLRGNARLSAAMTTITAAVVGVILNLSVEFSLRTLFAEVNTIQRAGIRFLVPEFASLDPVSLLIASAAAIALLRYKCGMLSVLAGCAAAGMIYTFCK